MGCEITCMYGVCVCVCVGGGGIMCVYSVCNVYITYLYASGRLVCLCVLYVYSVCMYSDVCIVYVCIVYVCIVYVCRFVFSVCI